MVLGTPGGQGLEGDPRQKLGNEEGEHRQETEEDPVSTRQKSKER